MKQGNTSSRSVSVRPVRWSIGCRSMICGSIVVRAGPRVPVLLVDGRTSGQEELRPTFYLANTLRQKAKVKVVDIDEFADEGRGDLTRYDCVFLCDVPKLTPNMVKRLTTHVRRGGGLVICLGDNAIPEAYNEDLFRNGAGLMPLPLTRLQAKTTQYNYYLSQDQATRGERPMHNLAGNPEQEALVEPRFRRFWRVGPPGSGGKPREVLTFRPVKIKRGDGRTTLGHHSRTAAWPGDSGMAAAAQAGARPQQSRIARNRPPYAWPRRPFHRQGRSGYRAGS